MVIKKNIKPGSGIGSSAASAAGIIAAANLLLEKGLSLNDQIRLAMEGEVLASGSRHADNLAPCIYGGLVLIRDTASFDIIPLHLPAMHVTVVHPQIEVKTSYARQILPREVPLSTAVKQWANVAGLIAGFLKEDYALISRSLQDHIVEPVRSKLIPGYDEVMKRCREAGVIGGGISGSGPSLFMLSRNRGTAEEAGEIMRDVYKGLGIDHKIYITEVSDSGVVAKKD
jgi:homoserine kinase